MHRRDLLRRVVNAATLATPIGLALAATGRASLRPGPRGTVLAYRYRSPFPAPRATAVTIGDVVLLRLDVQDLSARPRLLDHEVRHAVQWAQLLGMVGFPVAYGLASVWSLLRVGDAATANVFEVRAGLADGGYPPPDPQGRRRTAAASLSPGSPGRARWSRRRPRTAPSARPAARRAGPR